MYNNRDKSYSYYYKLKNKQKILELLMLTKKLKILKY